MRAFRNQLGKFSPRKDEDALITLFAFMPSLHENYDKAREQQKEEEGLEPRSDVVLFEEDRGML